jgi:uncharacterized protein (DUF2336 family)
MEMKMKSFSLMARHNRPLVVHTAVLIVALIAGQGSSFAASAHIQLSAVPEHAVTVDGLLKRSDELLRATQREMDSRLQQLQAP